MKIAPVTETMQNHFFRVEIGASEKSADISKIQDKTKICYISKAK